MKTKTRSIRATLKPTAALRNVTTGVAQRSFSFPPPKMRDDYSSRQAAKDKKYAQAFDDPETKKWVDSMTVEERAQAEKLGLLKPLLPKHGSGAPNHDMAESKLARVEAPSPDLFDPVQALQQPRNEAEIFDVVRRLISEIITQSNTRLTVECLALACGLTTMQGESMSSIADRHGISRAAVSRRCVDITKKLNLSPSRSMRSTKARNAYREKQLELSRKKTNDRLSLERARHNTPAGKPQV